MVMLPYKVSQTLYINGSVRSKRRLWNRAVYIHDDDIVLSVIDFPGIIKRTTAGVTTKSDMDLVERIVHGYMKEPRSVMLTVVSANVDIATQEILEKAEEVDPDDIRTFGVLTKPYSVDKGAEKNGLI